MIDDVPNDADDGSATATPEGSSVASELPPVEPPSAGFFIQLFLVPGLIVVAVVGVWALFGKMASGEQNWERLVEEIRNPNPHRRWRGALGLAQLLQTEPAEGSERLAENRKVAEALTGLLKDELQKASSDEDDVKQRAFLVRTLGMLDVPEVVIPVLREAMQHRDEEIRNNAIAAVAVIASRAQQRDDEKHIDAVVHSPGLLDDVIDLSTGSKPLLRAMAAFTLGLLPAKAAEERLEVLLGDGDEKVRVNAAIGLSRHKSTAGFGVFKQQLQLAAKKPHEDDETRPRLTEKQRTLRWFWLAVGVICVFLSAIWAVSTGSRGQRVVGAIACIGSLAVSGWQLFVLIEDRQIAPEQIQQPAAEVVDREKLDRERELERLVSVKNVIHAIVLLKDTWNTEQRSGLVKALTPLAESHPQPRIRIDAKNAVRELKAN